MPRVRELLGRLCPSQTPARRVLRSTRSTRAKKLSIKFEGRVIAVCDPRTGRRLDPEPQREQQPLEQQPIEQHPIEQQPVEQQPIEQQPIEHHPVEQQPTEQPSEAAAVAETQTEIPTMRDRVYTFINREPFVLVEGGDALAWDVEQKPHNDDKTAPVPIIKQEPVVIDNPLPNPIRLEPVDDDVATMPPVHMKWEADDGCLSIWEIPEMDDITFNRQRLLAWLEDAPGPKPMLKRTRQEDLPFKVFPKRQRVGA